MSFQENVCNTLDDAQTLYKERNAVYKDNFRKVGAIMTALFPQGVENGTEEDFNRWHIFELIMVKLTRYVANWEAGGHDDSIDDMIVYFGMLKELDHEFLESKKLSGMKGNHIHIENPGGGPMAPGMASSHIEEAHLLAQMTRQQRRDRNV